MKNTMKKILALALVLMITLTVPFAMLNVSAEEVTEADINGVTLFGNYVKEDLSTRAIGFYGSYPAVNAFDGDIATDAQNSNSEDLDYEMCYFDTDGVMKNGENASGSSYYVIWIFELAAETTVDTFSLWTSYDDRWMANNGYDIYYSADGNAYTAVEGASYSNVYTEKDTNGYYVAGTYNSKDGSVHEIDMKDATAKYIAIAVSDLVYEKDETIIQEVVVKGISDQVPSNTPNESADLAIAGVTLFGNYVNEDLSTRTIYFYGSYPAKNAFDGDIATDAQNSNSDTVGNLPYEMCYFDTDGVMKNGENTSGTSYYVIWIFELAAEATVDTFNLWTSYNDRWMANNGYDIYYSADGNAYTAVEGASYSNVYTEKDTNGYYVAGMYNSKDGSVHEIDMNGVTAKYIAIAVSDLVDERDESIVQEVVVKGTYVSGAPSTDDNIENNENNENNENGGNTNVTPETFAPPTVVTDAPETNAQTDAPAEGGCGGSIGFAGIALVTVCAAGVVLKSAKKKED